MAWITSANSEIYNNEKSFLKEWDLLKNDRSYKDKGFIDWEQRKKFEVGDIV